MSAPDVLDHTHPQLSEHFVFRWEDSQQAYILLYPEGLIKLNPSAGEVLKRCDGRRCLSDIVSELQHTFPEQAEQVAAGTRAFVELASEKGWLRLN